MAEGLPGERARQSPEKIAKRPGQGETKSRIAFTDGERNLGQGYTSPLPVVAKEVVHIESGKTRTFAVKQYFDEAYAKQSFFNYRRLKDAGLPVPPTLRRIEDEATVLTTDLSEGGRKVVESLTNQSKDKKGSTRLGMITNSQELQESLRAMARKAAEHGLRISADSLFFRFESGDSSPVDCVIGDFERTFYPDRNEVTQDLYQVNLEHAFLSLQGWLLYRNRHQAVQIDRKSILRGLDEQLFIKHWAIQDEDIPLPLSLKLIKRIRKLFLRE